MLHWHVFNVTYVLLHFWTIMQIKPRTFLFSSEKDAWDQRSEWQSQSAGRLATVGTVRHKPLSRHPCHLSYTPVTMVLLCTKTRTQGAGGQATLGWAGLCKAKLRGNMSQVSYSKDRKKASPWERWGPLPLMQKKENSTFFYPLSQWSPTFLAPGICFHERQFVHRPGEWGRFWFLPAAHLLLCSQFPNRGSGTPDLIRRFCAKINLDNIYNILYNKINQEIMEVIVISIIVAAFIIIATIIPAIIIITSGRIWSWGWQHTMISAVTFRQQHWFPLESVAMPRVRELELKDAQKTDSTDNL